MWLCWFLCSVKTLSFWRIFGKWVVRFNIIRDSSTEEDWTTGLVHPNVIVLNFETTINGCHEKKTVLRKVRRHLRRSSTYVYTFVVLTFCTQLLTRLVGLFVRFQIGFPSISDRPQYSIRNLVLSWCEIVKFVYNIVECKIFKLSILNANAFYKQYVSTFFKKKKNDFNK